MLDVLGLDEAEELAYRGLVELPAGSVEDVAAILGRPVVQTAPVLARLEAKGLVARSTSGPDLFVASPPAVALGALMVQRQEELRRAEHELKALTDKYQSATGERTINEIVDVVRGPQAVAQRFAQLQRTARSEVQILVKSEFAVVTPEENVDEELAIARGVSYRVAVERGLMERPGFFKGAADSIRSGVEVRVTQSVPLRLIIADRQIALVPLRTSVESDPGSGALLIHPSGLLEALQSVFDFVWDSSSVLAVDGDTLAETDPHHLDDLDVQVLSMLLAGLTDQAIGGQLGVSLRTAQRRVRQLISRAGVDTRVQLGYYAARNGWH